MSFDCHLTLSTNLAHLSHAQRQSIATALTAIPLHANNDAFFPDPDLTPNGTLNAEYDDQNLHDDFIIPALTTFAQQHGIHITLTYYTDKGDNDTYQLPSHSPN